MATAKKQSKKKTIIEHVIADIQPGDLVFPRVTVGNHLTITEFANGTTYLVWDDEALLKEVQEATK